MIYRKQNPVDVPWFPTKRTTVHRAVVYAPSVVRWFLERQRRNFKSCAICCDAHGEILVSDCVLCKSTRSLVCGFLTTIVHFWSSVIDWFGCPVGPTSGSIMRYKGEASSRGSEECVATPGYSWTVGCGQSWGGGPWIAGINTWQRLWLHKSALSLHSPVLTGQFIEHHVFGSE